MENQTDAAQVAAETMQDCGTIISMNQHKWGTEKTDQQTTAEVKQQKGASGKAGKYKVNLANGFERDLQTLTRPMSRAYHYYQRAGMAWKEGERMLSNVNLIEFLTEMQLHMAALDKAKAALAPRLPELISRAVALNGDLGKLSDYPSPQDIVDSYSFDFDFEPVPSSDAFGNLPEGFKEKFSENYNSKASARMKRGVDDVLERILALTEDFAGVLAKDKPKFFQSTLDKIAQLTSTLRGANMVVNDSDLNVICSGLDQVVCYTTDQLKNNMSAREAVAASCTACNAAMRAVLGTTEAEPQWNEATDHAINPVLAEPEGDAHLQQDLPIGGTEGDLLDPGALMNVPPEEVSTVETAEEQQPDEPVDDVDDDIASLFTNL